jgi:hypothetical protein
MSRRGFWIAALIALTALGSAAAQEDELREEYRAFGVAMGPGAAGVLDIVITRWSTEEERKLLIDALVQKGTEEAVKLLRDQKETGFVRTQSGVGRYPSVRLHYAYQFQLEGKRRVVLVTDRPIGMAEAMRNPRSTEYDISAVIMEFYQEDGKDKGEGTLLVGAKLAFDKDQNKLEVESLGSQPVRLTNIKREK